jgi:hypothetical protein
MWNISVCPLPTELLLHNHLSLTTLAHNQHDVIDVIWRLPVWSIKIRRIGRAREGQRLSITFALYVRKIFISRVCKCATRNVLTICRRKNISISMWSHVKIYWRRLNLSKNPKYTLFTIKSSFRSHITKSYIIHFKYQNKITRDRMCINNYTRGRNKFRPLA